MTDPGVDAQEDRQRILALVFLAIGAGAGIAAGLLEYFGVFREFGETYPLPNTDFELFVGASVIFPGVIYGLATGIALYLLGFVDTDRVTSFTLATTLAGIIGDNTGYFAATAAGESATTGAFWVVDSAVHGLINAAIMATAAVALFYWCRNPRRWLALVFVGGGAGALAGWLAFGWLDDPVLQEADASQFYLARLAYMAIFYGAFGAVMGAFVPTGRPAGRRPFQIPGQGPWS